MSELDNAWQAALAAEHQAVFGYPLAGVRLTGAQRALAVDAFTAHAAVRDALESAIATAGLTPVVTRADYPQLYPVDTATVARTLAVRLEDDCASAWRFLYAQCVATSGARSAELRLQAQQQLIACAVRAVQWRSTIDPARATTAFPGIEI